MNKKGFTLVELLATLVILVSISMIAVFNITASIERRDVKECEEQVNLAKNAAKIYFSLNDSLKDEEKVITVDELKQQGYLKEEKSTKIQDGSIKFNKDTGNYEITTNGECKNLK